MKMSDKSNEKSRSETGHAGCGQSPSHFDEFCQENQVKSQVKVKKNKKRALSDTSPEPASPIREGKSWAQEVEELGTPATTVPGWVGKTGRPDPDRSLEGSGGKRPRPAQSKKQKLASVRGSAGDPEESEPENSEADVGLSTLSRLRGYLADPHKKLSRTHQQHIISEVEKLVNKVVLLDRENIRLRACVDAAPVSRSVAEALTSQPVKEMWSKMIEDCVGRYLGGGDRPGREVNARTRREEMRKVPPKEEVETRTSTKNCAPAGSEEQAPHRVRRGKKLDRPDFAQMELVVAGAGPAKRNQEKAGAEKVAHVPDKGGDGTWAQVVKRGRRAPKTREDVVRSLPKAVKKEEPREAQLVLCLKEAPDSDQTSPHRAQERIINVVDAIVSHNTLGADIRGVSVSKGGKILVKTASREVAEGIAAKLDTSASLGGRVMAAVHSKSLPKVSVRGIPTTWDVDKITEAVKAAVVGATKAVDQGSMKIRPCFKIGPRDGYFSTWVCEVSPTMRTKMLEKTLRSGLYAFRAADFLRPCRCFKCQGYGHMARFCCLKSVCSWCASDDHTLEKCSARSKPPVCAACKRNGRSPDHPGNSGSCPTMIGEMRRMRDKTHYG